MPSFFKSGLIRILYQYCTFLIRIVGRDYNASLEAKFLRSNYVFVSNVCNAMCVLFRKNSLVFLSDAYGKKLSSREVNSHFYIYTTT